MALKKVRLDRSREGVPVTSVRELAILQKARHPNIVKLQKVVTGTRADRYVGTYRQRNLRWAIAAVVQQQ